MSKKHYQVITTEKSEKDGFKTVEGFCYEVSILLGDRRPFLRYLSPAGIKHVTKEKAIEMIEKEEITFYVLNENGYERINVEVVAENGNKFLKTSTNGISKNELLTLEDCKHSLKGHFH